MKSQICLSLFVLLVGIFSFTQVQGSELTALDFEQIDFLFPIENEETGAALLSSGDTNIAATEEEGTSPVEEESGSGGTDPDIVCSDKNCATCTTTSPGTCTACDQGYEVEKGRCKKISNKVACKIRFEGTLAKFTAAGGKKDFEKKYTKILDLSDGQVNVTSVVEGSIIVDFDVFVPSTSKFTATQIKTNLDTLAKSDPATLDIYGEGIKDYYGSDVVVVAVDGSCPAGKYADANGVCQACEEGCTYCESDGKCKGANVGAIVGGILGGLALIMVIVVAYVKRDVLFKGFSSSPKSPNRAAYYAAGPVSPTEQAPLQA